jgi:hypothetical protein
VNEEQDGDKECSQSPSCIIQFEDYLQSLKEESLFQNLQKAKKSDTSNQSV